MTPPVTSSELVFNIAAAERDIGLSKDTLRVWEGAMASRSRGATPPANGCNRPGTANKGVP